MKKRPHFLYQDRTIISQKVVEAFSSVLPITLIVLALCFTIVPLDSGMFLAFLLGALCVIVGMGLFTLGADTAMTPIGEYVGTSVMRTKKMWIIILVCFIVGVLITVSEPDLQVLATQLSATMNPRLLIIAIGVGVAYFGLFIFGIALTISEWRALKTSAIKKIFYMFTFPLYMFTFIPICFVALFKRRVTWVPIIHENKVSLDDLKSGE